MEQIRSDPAFVSDWVSDQTNPAIKLPDQKGISNLIVVQRTRLFRIGGIPKKGKIPHPCKGHSALESSVGKPGCFYYFQSEYINMPFYLKRLELVSPSPESFITSSILRNRNIISIFSCPRFILPLMNMDMVLLLIPICSARSFALILRTFIASLITSRIISLSRNTH